jgi:ribonuclease BN (tRNA processing enzyme)
MAKVDITFLGTGSAFSKRYGNNSAVVSVLNDGVVKNLMIDCGRTTPDDLAKSEFNWNDIDAIFVTHLHGDHVYGLEEAGFMGRFVFQKKPHIILPHRKVKIDLWDKVLKGTMMNGDLERNMTFDDYFTYDIADETLQYFEFNGVMFSVYATQHVPNKKSYGLIIGEYDFVVYTSDSLFDEEFIKIASQEGAQKIFHDCQLTLDELSTLPQEVREKIVVMHYGDDIEGYYLKINKDLGMKVAVSNHRYSFTVGG